MTQEEFVLLFRGRLLMQLSEVWCLRKETPSNAGMLMDKHHLENMKLLREMYDTLKKAFTEVSPPVTTRPTANGPVSQTRKT